MLPASRAFKLPEWFGWIANLVSDIRKRGIPSADFSLDWVGICCCDDSLVFVPT